MFGGKGTMRDAPHIMLYSVRTDILMATRLGPCNVLRRKKPAGVEAVNRVCEREQSFRLSNLLVPHRPGWMRRIRRPQIRLVAAEPNSEGPWEWKEPCSSGTGKTYTSACHFGELS